MNRILKFYKVFFDKNFIAGIYLLLERPFAVGDEITVGIYTGRVELIDIRTTQLLTGDGNRVIVPNTMILSQVVLRRIAPPPQAGESPPDPEEENPEQDG